MVTLQTASPTNRDHVWGGFGKHVAVQNQATVKRQQAASVLPPYILHSGRPFNSQNIDLNLCSLYTYVLGGLPKPAPRTVPCVCVCATGQQNTGMASHATSHEFAPALLEKVELQITRVNTDPVLIRTDSYQTKTKLRCSMHLDRTLRWTYRRRPVHKCPAQECEKSEDPANVLGAAVLRKMHVSSCKRCEESDRSMTR